MAYQREAEKFIAANPKLKIAVISGSWEKWLRRIETGRMVSDAELRVPMAVRGESIESPRFDGVLLKP